MYDAETSDTSLAETSGTNLVEQSSTEFADSEAITLDQEVWLYIICSTKVLMKIKYMHVVLWTRTLFCFNQNKHMPLFPSLCQMQKPNYWNIVEGQFGEMLVGQDGDIMLEASTWKLIQKKLNGNKLVQQPHTGSVFVIIAIN